MKVIFKYVSLEVNLIEEEKMKQFFTNSKKETSI